MIFVFPDTTRRNFWMHNTPISLDMIFADAAGRGTGVVAKPEPFSTKMSRSEEVVAKHKKYIWPSVTNYYQNPLVADHAEMQHVWDVEGRKYLDFFGGILTVSVGHCNPKITSKVNAQVNRLQHLSTLYPNEQIVALAEKVAQITPGNLQSSFFTSSGSEADEAAILIARMATGSYDVVALRHAYSGGSSLMKSVTAHAPYRKAAVISVGISHAINPYCYRCPLHLKYPECEVACAGDVENLIQTGTSGSIAAFIAEPIQGVGGFITPPKEYFKIVFSIVKKYGGLFISDEVQTGWGRTGKKWFGIEQWEVTPDILTSAKGMANGVPVGLTVTTPEIAAGFQGLNIATFGGNPVTCAAARATIELIEEEDLRENAHTVGNYFRAKLEELQQKYPLIGDVRGMGLMLCLAFVMDKKTKEPMPADWGFGKRIIVFFVLGDVEVEARLFELGAVFRPCVDDRFERRLLLEYRLGFFRVVPEIRLGGDLV